MAGEFQQLLPFKWRDQHLPLTKIQVSLAHDLVEHKYWGVDGARVEATGVAPVRISAVIPLSNHIYPGAQEKWSAGDLYPTALRAFIISFAKRTTGLLQHPEFGQIACKPDRMEFELSGESQGATAISASWVETLDDDVVSNVVSSPVVDIEITAASLEANMASLRKLVPTLPSFDQDLGTFIRKLSAFPDAITILSYRQAGVINNILYQCGRLEAALLRAKNALTWAAIQNVQRIKSAAYTARAKFLRPGGVGLYVVPASTTLAATVSALPAGTKFGEVIRLNPDLVRTPLVSKGTPVRYRLVA